MTLINSLIHKGIMLSDIPYQKLSIEIQGKPLVLTPLQEEMAIAWVRKLSTDYVDDPVFCKNFFEDFSEVLGQENLTDEDIDFSEVIEYIEKERARKEALSKEEKKAQREQRKVIREELKEIYGSALLDDEPVEISNWTAEPSSIFMGRGEHPMRGKWKQGPNKGDIILNHSNPDLLEDKDEWKEIIWAPETLWIAKWTDKLSGKTKYVWLSDNTPIKQNREIEKFNKSKRVGENLKKIRAQTNQALKSENKRLRKVALACYIIDHLILRVGDEKDEDEADTVGATTLRPEHVTITGNQIRFKFLGKDSVEWNKVTTFPDFATKVLQELIDEANESGVDKPQIFSKINSTHVNEFFGNIVEDLTAKVFRTFHASNTVRTALEESDTDANDPDYKKKEAAVMANREAAVICTHMKAPPKDDVWANRVQRFRERKIKADERISKAKLNEVARKERLEVLKENLATKKVTLKEAEKILQQTKEAYQTIREQPVDSLTDKEKTTHKKAVEKAKKSVETKKKKVETAKKRIESAKNQLERGKNSLGTAKERVFKANEAYKKILSQERISKKTKTWNLGTSLKSYIDPRIYYEWGKEVEYDWTNYYSSTLQKKFSWVERDEEED
ncbi:MAG: hypothetical protein ACTSSB_14655 [Candidatus Heimdallarchaeota archaeon]